MSNKVSFKYGTAAQLENAPIIDGTFYVVSESNSENGTLYIDLNGERISIGNLAEIESALSDISNIYATKDNLTAATDSLSESIRGISEDYVK